MYAASDHFYIQEIPTNDSWGTPYDYVWAGTIRYSEVIGIRSLGRDQETDGNGDTYTMGPFDSNDYNRDIVWADGFFIRYPAGLQVQ